MTPKAEEYLKFLNDEYNATGKVEFDAAQFMQDMKAMRELEHLGFVDIEARGIIELVIYHPPRPER